MGCFLVFISSKLPLLCAYGTWMYLSHINLSLTPKWDLHERNSCTPSYKEKTKHMYKQANQQYKSFTIHQHLTRYEAHYAGFYIWLFWARPVSFNWNFIMCEMQQHLRKHHIVKQTHLVKQTSLMTRHVLHWVIIVPPYNRVSFLYLRCICHGTRSGTGWLYGGQHLSRRFHWHPESSTL